MIGPEGVFTEEASMRGPWRPLVLAVAVNLALGVGVATAQTLIVRKAPPGSSIELTLNAATIGSVAPDPAGDGRFAVDLPSSLGKPEADARLFVDVCGDRRRILLVESFFQPAPPEAGCDRQQLIVLFLLRQVTTLLVDFGGPNVRAWLRQGPVPEEWLTDEEPDAVRPPREWHPAATGLVPFGGGGLVKFRDVAGTACGNLEGCAVKDFPFAYTVGATFWFTRFLGAEASYVRPGTATVDGDEESYRFQTTFDADLLSVAGVVGFQVGPVKPYGKVGMLYHRAFFRTTQTIDPIPVTIDGEVVATVEGGTDSFEVETRGWGWQFGGGAEVWVTRPVALYGEFGRAALKGDYPGGAEGKIDDRVTFILFGVKVRLGR